MNPPNPEVAWLLDVNALIALMDSNHVHHETMHRWFARHSREGWATCPVTENGAIRVLSQPAYPSGRRAPIEVVEMLRLLKANHRADHKFCADDVSLTDPSLFDAVNFVTVSHLTDVYLLGMALRHDARLVSFDRRLPWQAIRGGSAHLIEHPV